LVSPTEFTTVADGRIAHELLGQLGKVGREWDPRVVPSGLMRELVQSVENGTITGEMNHWE
jgi:hypothetical protein